MLSLPFPLPLAIGLLYSQEYLRKGKVPEFIGLEIIAPPDRPDGWVDESRPVYFCLCLAEICLFCAFSVLGSVLGNMIHDLLIFKILWQQGR